MAVDVQLAGAFGLQAVAKMKQAAILMKRAARQAFAMASNSNIAAEQARSAVKEIEIYVNGEPPVMVRDFDVASSGNMLSSISGQVQSIDETTLALHAIALTVLHGESARHRDDGREEDDESSDEKEVTNLASVSVEGKKALFGRLTCEKRRRSAVDLREFL